ncbi:hypothetical protein [Pseudemcibacter aquimaris]|uniref:hypothetical protein n=1 Tax=Pseudemcibacter aquimaris TaxID=2857064 RepID=UPI0020138E01|nr:hypothetical protein [Pseudemcibacter aquimaris]MCC3861736.1 hypothetical protein [Pseudemcibacter aquimaris]WDU58505.1 hypothetical protein KW060_15040 [Pseudemcibacter aquimaris]
MKLFKWILLIGCLSVQHAFAQTDEYGRADASVPELAQFEYLRGTWRVEMEIRGDDGVFKKLENIATVKAYYHPDGKSFQTIFSTKNGGFTTDIRTYNIKEKKWDVLFMNAKAQRWHRFEAKLTHGIMTTFVYGGYSGKENFDVKIMDINVTDAGFTKEVFYKTKGTDEWVKQYIMRFSPHS